MTRNSEIGNTPSEFCPISGDWGKLWMLQGWCWMLHSRVTAFTISELSMTNQKEEGEGGLKECLLKNAFEKMNLENHRVNNLCLKSLYLGFILFLCFSIWTVIIMNIQWNKQSCYTLRFPLKPVFLGMFLLHFLNLCLCLKESNKIWNQPDLKYLNFLTLY